MKKEILKILKSRTFWAIFIMGVMSNLQMIKDFIDPRWFAFLMTNLSLLATYFKFNPSQEYK